RRASGRGHWAEARTLGHDSPLGPPRRRCRRQLVPVRIEHEQVVARPQRVPLELQHREAPDSAGPTPAISRALGDGIGWCRGSPGSPARSGVPEPVSDACRATLVTSESVQVWVNPWGLGAVPAQEVQPSAVRIRTRVVRNRPQATATEALATRACSTSWPSLGLAYQ